MSARSTTRRDSNQMPGFGVFRIETGASSPRLARPPSRGLPRRRMMKVLKILLTLVLVIGVLGGAAYAGGRLVNDHHRRTVASSGDLPGAPASSTPSSPTSSPTSPSTPSTPTTP